MHIRKIIMAAAMAAAFAGVQPALAAGSSADIPAASSAQASLTPEQAEKAALAEEAKLMASLHPRTGNVPIPEADATLMLGDNYYFLDKEEARKVVVDIWGNPPEMGEDVLGLVFPKGGTPYRGWGAVVTFLKTDYVPDDDASTRNYDSYVTDIQKGEKEENEKRQKDGYSSMHLVGWAQPPSYNKAHHYLIWARDLQIGGTSVDTLNYDVRLLGRRGVLSLNMIAGMPELASIRTQAEQLALAGQYNNGARYEDYQKGDAKAAFSLGGLVAAGLGVAAAKKLGLLAVILAFGKKAIVLVLAAFAAIGRWFSTRFGKKKKGVSPVPRPAFDDPVDTPADAVPPSSGADVVAEKTPPSEDA